MPALLSRLRQKLLTFWKLVLAPRKEFLPPRRCEVLVYDASNQHLLQDYLRPWSVQVLHLRGETLNLPCFVRSLFKPGPRTDAYIDAYIEATKPRLVITLLDNDRRFYGLRQRRQGMKTLFIQNGWRGYYADIFELLDQMDPCERAGYGVDYMLTFGAEVGDEYAKYLVGQVVPIGSFKNNHIPLQTGRDENQLLFISQFHEGGIDQGGNWFSHDDFFRGPDETVLRCLKQYAERSGKRLVVAPRYRQSTPERAREIEHFRSILGPGCEIHESDEANPSYAAIDRAGVVVAIDSSLAYESLARGLRTAIFSIRSKRLGLKGLTYGWPGRHPDTGFFWTNRADPEAFTAILDRLFAATDEAWTHTLAESGFPRITAFDAGNRQFVSLLQRIMEDQA
jgi:surface carbohydrate biosynthesis protein